MPTLVRSTLLATAVVLASAMLAHAQSADKPALPRCGGLFCDLYYQGVPAGQTPSTGLACHDFVCGMFGGRDQPVAAIEPPPAAPAPVTKKGKTATKRKAVAAAEAVQ